MPHAMRPSREPENSMAPANANHAQTSTTSTNAAADTDVQMTSRSASTPTTTKKRKRTQKPHILHTATFKHAPWSYHHLELITPGTALPLHTPTPSTTNTNTHAVPAATPPPSSNTDIDIDALTVCSLLQPPLTSYLGLTGSSIPIDILKTRGRETWIRVPRQDARALRASLAGWVGQCGGDLVPGVGGGEARVKVAWRMRGEGETLGVLEGNGQDLFAC